MPEVTTQEDALRFLEAKGLLDGRRSHRLEELVTDGRLRREAKRILDAEEAGGGSKDRLEIVTAAELVARVRALPPPRWLARGVWPGDAYGVLAAEWKAGKTWAVHDLAVAVATGGKWLGRFQVDRAGAVLMFLGEGGERKMERRLRAVAAAAGVELEELPIRLCFRSPHLRDGEELGIIAAHLKATPAALSIVDPLYLAVRGAKGSSLYEMGETLEGIQHVCQEATSALAVATHWNRNERASGSGRITGAGPAEWGRVLVNAEVRSKRTEAETNASVVVLRFTFEGDEIPDSHLTIRRRIWADRPDDITSPLHYELTEVADEQRAGPGAGLRPSDRRVLLALAERTAPATVMEIGDTVAEDDSGMNPLRARTIQESLGRLGDWVENDGAVPPRPRHYGLTAAGKAAAEELGA